MRFQLGMRKKSNCKNKTWAETEPVLLRYFKGLRRRLQLGEEADADADADADEPEPGDEEEAEEPDMDSEDDMDDEDEMAHRVKHRLAGAL